MHHTPKNPLNFQAASRQPRRSVPRYSSGLPRRAMYVSLQLPHLSCLAMNLIAMLVLREHTHLMRPTDTSVAPSVRSLQIHNILSRRSTTGNPARARVSSHRQSPRCSAVDPLFSGNSAAQFRMTTTFHYRRTRRTYTRESVYLFFFTRREGSSLRPCPKESGANRRMPSGSVR